MARREFFRNSTKAVAGATALMSGVGAAAETRPSSKRVSANDAIHIGAIGIGGMGKTNLRDFLRVPEVECLALADVDQEHLEEGLGIVEEVRGGRPDGYSDFRRIIDRDDIDAVIISTPDHWHAIPAVLACQAGKDVYVEKPLATTIEEGRAIVKAARRNNRVVQVGTQQRSAGHFQNAVSFVRSGDLGVIRMIRAWTYLDWKGDIGHPPDGEPPAHVDYDMWLGPAPDHPFNPMRFHHNFRWFWDYSGGLMTDWGAHMIDVVMWAMEADPIGAMAIGGKYGFPDDIRETPDTQQSIVEFPDFSMQWEHMIGCGVGPWQREHGVEFHGENGILVVDRGGWEVHSETDRFRQEERVHRMTPTPRQAPSADYHFTHVQDFLECLKSRSRPVADVEIGHKSAIACHLANIAVRLRRYVRWDPETEMIIGDEEGQSLTGRIYRKPWELPEE